jgi:multicomponent Na+:H+ antiporter subunit F
MDAFFIAAAVTIVGISLVTLYRVVISRIIFNQLLAVGVVGTNAIALMALIGFIFNRPNMFIDLALTYALLNFVATVAAAKVLEHHGGDQP